MTSPSRSLHRSHERLVLLMVALLLGLSLNLGILPAASAATTITVTTTVDELNSDGDCALREAIRAANLDTAVDACPAGSGADTVIVPAGIYTLTIAGNENHGLAGDLDMTGTLHLDGAGAGTTIIDGNSLDRVVDIRSGATVIVSDVTMRNGRVTGPRNGGGISNLGTLELANSRITGNYGSDFVADVDNGGGGIFNTGTLQVTSSSVDHNSSGDEGGGIYNMGTLEISDSHFDNNTAGFGAGIWNKGTATLVHSTVIGNTADFDSGIINYGTLVAGDSIVSGNSTGFLGAGGINNNGTAMLTKMTITDNFTNGRGGGIANFAQLTVTTSTISGNTATAASIPEDHGGGGIFTQHGSLTMTNSTVSDNLSGTDGGGIFANQLSDPGCCPPNFVELNNVTVTENSAKGDGGGIAIHESTVNVQNTIVSENSDQGGQAPDCAGTLSSQGYNLIQHTTGCTITDDTTGNLLGVDPLLGPLQDNGGPTLTHALLPGSPAIDAGNPAAPGSGGSACEAIDQRGITRPQDGDGDGTLRCDFGAFESQPTVTVMQVEIDIKPGSTTNPINMKTQGVIAVAILSTEDFDATTVDAATICFGDAEETSQRDCTEKHGTGHKMDVSRDGRPDLVLHYETQQTGIDRGDIEACLTGETTAGRPVAGCDTIRAR